MRSKRRTAATGMAIALGFAGFLIIGGFYERVARLLEVYTVYPLTSGHLQVYRRDGLRLAQITPTTHALDGEDLGIIKTAVQQMENVEFSGGRILGEGFVSNGCTMVPFIAIATEPRINRAIRDHPLVKRWLGTLMMVGKGRDIAAYDPVIGPIAITPGMGRMLSKDLVYDQVPTGRPLVPLGDCQSPASRNALALDANVQLVAAAWDGIFSTTDAEIVTRTAAGQTDLENTLVVAPLSLLQSLYHTEGATSYSVWLKDPSKLKQDLALLQGLLQRTGRTYEIFQWDDERINPYYVGQMKFMAVLFTFLAGVASLVIMFSIFNSATIAVIERTKEIGMFRAIGFRRAYVERLFVVEFFLLCLFALLAGVLLGTVGALIINHLNLAYEPPSIAVPLTIVIVPSWKSALAGTIIITGATLFASFSVARKACRQQITHILNQAHR
ncbi:MAG: FtsX-like permease family protein [Proteobacteria bacterium]|nr:FtsX-like permease family protein [Pseudomonadota bacterium]